MNLTAINQALRASWDAASSYCGAEWAEDNPARGQCVVSSLVVQDYLGGDLLRFLVKFDGIEEKHYVNIIDGMLVDVSHSQYSAKAVVYQVSPPDMSKFTSIRERILSDNDTDKRYRYLKRRVDTYLTDQELVSAS